MTIQLFFDETGAVDRKPRRIAGRSTMTLNQLTTAGVFTPQTFFPNALNNQDIIDMFYGCAADLTGGTYTELTVSISGGVLTLAEDVSEGNVTLPVVSGDFAIFNGTTGNIKDAGYSPTDPTQTKVAMFTGTTTANRFAIFAASNGTIGEVPNSPGYHLNDINAGQSGTKGILYSFPTAPTTGSLSLAGVSNSGNFNTVISNVAQGQATTYSIPDAANATANFLVTAASITSGHFPVATGGSNGAMADSGAAIHTGVTSTFAGGSTTFAATVAGVTTGSVIGGAVILTSTNSVSITKAVPTANTITFTFSADPGAGTVVQYFRSSAAF